MHIQSIGMSTVRKGSLVNARADVLVVNASGQPVASATVYGQWSGLTSDSDQKLTSSSGHAIVDSNKVSSGSSGTFTFTVTNITKSGWTYDPASNVQTSASILYP